MIETPRLLLRAYTLDDAPMMWRLINVREVARNTLRIPYPYPEEEAERWVASHDERVHRGDHAFAITLRETHVHQRPHAAERQRDPLDRGRGGGDAIWV